MLINLPIRRRMLNVSALSIALTFFFLSVITFAATGSYATVEDMEVLTRGPIHEAFADVSVDETPSGPVIPRPVPEPINEVPPEVRPEGNRIEWISGYWSWDEDQNDFIWVSGVWRDVPPDRQWIPGYWQSVDGGHRYVSGYWADINQTPTEYLPPPPEPLQAGPSSPASSPDYVWMDGNWVWSQNGYAWQPGYWYEPRPDMVWVPAHYVWTPRGYTFVMGYWDYLPDQRGVMFAPLYYPRPIYRHYGYFYRPHIILDTNVVFLSLFVRRGSHHYYFGDYHHHRYEKRGFRPWYSRQANRYGHDPFYRTYRQHRMRDDRHWENNYRRQSEYRRSHKDARPSQRFKETREHQVKQPQPPANQRIGKIFGDALDNRTQAEQMKRLKPVRGQQTHSPSGKNTNFQADRKKIAVPNPQGQARQPRTEVRKPARTAPFAVPGKSKEERQEYADQQNRQLGNQRYQQQNQGNGQAGRMLPWVGRSTGQSHGK